MARLPFYRDVWRSVMAERIFYWNGFVCQILSEDSISCSELNNYISEFWVNLDARLERSHLLMFAVGSPDEEWFEKERERIKHFSYGTRKVLEKLLNFYQKGGIKNVMAGVHDFVQDVEWEINKHIELPAIIFPRLINKEEISQRSYKDEDDKIEDEDYQNHKEFRYSDSMEFQYYIFEMLKYSTKAQIENTLFGIMDITKESWEENKSYEEFIKKIKWFKNKVKFLGLAKKAVPIIKYSLPILKSEI